MTITLSTTQKIQAAMSGYDDWACVGSYYLPWWKETCICGHAIKEVYVIGHANDHGPAYSLPTFKIGSECFKYLTKDPAFLALSLDLQERRKEIARIQRRMKREREDAFHASADWRELEAYFHQLASALWSFQQRPGYVNYLKPLGITLSDTLSRKVAVVHAQLRNIDRGDLRFQDLETAQALQNECVTLVTSLLEELRPHAEKIQAKVMRGFEGVPGWGGLKFILDKL